MEPGYPLQRGCSKQGFGLRDEEDTIELGRWAVGRAMVDGLQNELVVWGVGSWVNRFSAFVGLGGEWKDLVAGGELVYGVGD